MASWPCLIFEKCYRGPGANKYRKGGREEGEKERKGGREERKKGDGELFVNIFKKKYILHPFKEENKRL